MLFSIALLLIFGLVMIYSTSAYEANATLGDASFYLRKQIMATILGIVAFLITSLIPYELYRKMPWWVPVVGGLFFFALLLAPSLRYSANGATRWVKIGGITLQPAEIAKLAVILYMAKLLYEKGRELRDIYEIAGALVVPGVFFVIITVFTSNLSSGIIVAGIAYFMIAISSRKSWRYVVLMLVVILIAAIFVFAVKRGWDIGYRGDRIKAWLDPEAFASGIGYQTLQALYAIGSGGLTGKGIGESVQKLGFIPEAQNDMIFSIICEELGIIGAFLIMLLFLVLIHRCSFIAANSSDMFGCFLAMGVMIHISMQVILNIAVVTNLIPNTGISLPFISYGGTAILFLMAEMGIVINVGRNIERR